MRFPATALLVPLFLCGEYSRADTDAPQPVFFKQHCLECHDAATHEGNLDLSSLKLELASPDNFARWVKIHDRIPGRWLMRRRRCLRRSSSRSWTQKGFVSGISLARAFAA